ncbi:MAG: hypothetical protein RL885_25030 [Planctomycetota bacterium]
MPDPSISDILADDFVTNAVNVMRFGEGTRRRSLELLRLLEDELVAKLAQHDPTGVERAPFRIRRMEAMLEQTRETIRTARKRMASAVRSELLDLGEVQAGAIPNLMNEVLGAPLLTVAVTPQDLRSIVSDKALMGGQPLSDYWDSVEDKLHKGWSQQVRLGVLAGEDMEQIARRLRGAPTGRKVEVEGKAVREYAGGLMDGRKHEITTLTRTAVQAVSNDVIKKTLDANADLIRGYQLLATLDGSTSVICRSRAGAIWDPETGDALPESPRQESFPGPPPYHPRCRSVLVPVTKSWEQLIEEQTGRRRKVLDTVPNSTRASMDGQVAGSLTYEGWLRSKPKDFQIEVLGPARWKLWKEGRITMAQLTDFSGRERTLDELRELAGKSAPKARHRPVPPKPSGSGASRWTGAEMVQEARALVLRTREQIGSLTAQIDLGKRELQDFSKRIRRSRKAESRDRLRRERIDHWRDHVRPLQRERRELRRLELNDVIRGWLPVDDPVELDVRMAKGRKLPAGYRDNIREARQFVQSIVSRSGAKSGYRVTFFEDWNEPGERRSWYLEPHGDDNNWDPREFQAYKRGLRKARPTEIRGVGGMVISHEEGGISTLVHELGHSIEIQGDRLKDAVAFLKDRAKADPRGRRLLREITGVSKYRDNEYAWEDEFVEAYMGKDYDGSATELVSMGLELLYENPAYLLEFDSGMFAWVIDLIRGKF